MRLIVMFAVSSEFLCNVADLTKPCPSDKTSIDLQIDEAKTFEKRIAEEEGGWYKIVYSPEEAREAIRQEKLALVLGVEATNAFSCKFISRDAVWGVKRVLPPIIDNLEIAWQNVCGSQETGLESLQTQQALALFDHYWQLGVRHFFPIHNMDGTAGGAAISIPLLHDKDNPSRVKDADFYDRVTEMDAMDIPIDGQVTGSAAYTYQTVKATR